MKRQLLQAEKAAVVERQRALILASRPNVIVSIHVEDETDHNGRVTFGKAFGAGKFAVTFEE